MILRRLMGSACLHFAVLLGAGLWYGAVAAREEVEAPILSFVPERPELQVVTKGSPREPLEVEPSPEGLELPAPAFPENFDSPQAQLPPELMQPEFLIRFDREVLFGALSVAAKPALPPLLSYAVESAESVAALPLPAFVPATPRAELNHPPHYPRSARLRGEEGSLRLRLTIDVDGKVIDVELLAPCRYPALNRAAMEAVRKWRYWPAKRVGIPSGDSIIETIIFRIGA